jgi:hypothetical protein
MAQTKRKRKHRGTQAGTVEARGRTGRRPQTQVEARKVKRERRANRFDRPPTWRSAALRALAAAGIFLAAIVLFFKQPVVQAVSLSAFMVLVYMPMGYYTDLFLYRRRQQQKLKAKDGA